jgi:hypothetical protein
MGKVVLDLTMSLDSFVAGPRFDDIGVEPIELKNTRVIESAAVTQLKFRVIK